MRIGAALAYPHRGEYQFRLPALGDLGTPPRGSRPHCRQRKRPASVSTCTFSGGSECPLPHTGGTTWAFVAVAPTPSWTSLKHTTALDWLQITPPLQHNSRRA